MTVTIDWENLGFSYMKLPYRYLAHFKNGQWDQGELTEDATFAYFRVFSKSSLWTTSI